MTSYRRPIAAGATWFFTVNCARRQGNRLLVEHIEQLRDVFRAVRQRHPFHIDAIVVLPEHLHCIWTLPPGDTDFGRRWALIKAGFSRAIPAQEHRSASRIRRGERGVWQRRFWEHLIRDQDDLSRHVDYIHWNPVKHGWVRRVGDWPHSSFHQYVRRGIYPEDWCGGVARTMDGGEWGE
ncbi:MAG: transposase [Gammaproteobacteria bacterium]|nr:MAG: transposase [Gammaproteobacteria bacterium]